MKQLLVIAIALASTTAFASRARVTSLGNSAHITDTQSIFSNPAKMFLMGDFVSLESGKTATNTVSGSALMNNNAEGTIVRSMGDAKVGLGLGHKSTNASGFGSRGLLSAGALAAAGIQLEQQNPIELFYGMKSSDLTWAGTLVYSNFNDKQNDIKESSMGVRLGALMGAWDISAAIGLGNKVETAIAGPTKVEFKGTTGVSLYAGYTMNSMYYFGEVVLAGAKMDVGGNEAANVDAQKFTIGAVESVKKDGNEFFYGASLVNSTVKNDGSALTTDDTKETSMSLPIIVGLEAEATSWLTLRGSLTQTVILDNSKKETGSTTNFEFAPGENNTAVAVGAGLKFNKVTVDGTLTGLTTDSTGAANQQLNGNDLLTTVGLTYMF